MVAFIVAVRKRPTVTKGWIGACKKRNTTVCNSLETRFTDFRKANEGRMRAGRDGESSLFESWCWGTLADGTRAKREAMWQRRMRNQEEPRMTGALKDRVFGLRNLMIGNVRCQEQYQERCQKRCKERFLERCKDQCTAMWRRRTRNGEESRATRSFQGLRSLWSAC